MSRGGCSSDLAGMGCDTGCCAVWAPPFPLKGVGGSAPAICGALFLPVSLPFETASERTQVGGRGVLKVALLMFLKPANQLHGNVQSPRFTSSACATSQKVIAFIHLQCHKGHS